MTKRAGFNPVRDPYPWDGAELLANRAAWSCCGMTLPTTYHICPICEKERGFEAYDTQRDCAGS